MDCFHDFCLACDKESNGPYCSQACRLADLERASPAMMSLANTTSQQASQSRLSWSSTSSTSASDYVLSPAYDFTDKGSWPQTSYFMRTSPQPAERSLTPSSSRSSLSSTTSNASATASGGLSEQSRLELNNYFSSFSRARAAKRRASLR